MAATPKPRPTRYMSYANPLTFRLSDVSDVPPSRPATFHGVAVYYDDTEPNHEHPRPFAHIHEHTHKARLTVTHEHIHIHSNGGIRNHHTPNGINAYHSKDVKMTAMPPAPSPAPPREQPDEPVIKPTSQPRPKVVPEEQDPTPKPEPKPQPK